NPIPPGAFIAVLAFIAAVVLPRRGWKRAVVVGLLFSLMVGEIYVLRREQNTANDHFDYIADRFNSIDRLLVATQQSQVRVDDVAKNPTPQTELKRTAVTLSSEILKFLIERNMNEPPLPTLGDLRKSQPGGFGPWQIAADNYAAYSSQTAQLYTEKFGPSVATVHDELKKRGLANE